MRPTKSTFALLAALLLALLTLALAPARAGAKLLINDLFSLSESANAYVYDRLPVAAGASRLPACALLGGALAFLSAAVALTGTSVEYSNHCASNCGIRYAAVPALTTESSESVGNTCETIRYS